MIQDHTRRKFEMASNTVHDLMAGNDQMPMAMVIIQCSEAIASEIGALRETVQVFLGPIEIGPADATEINTIPGQTVE